MILINNPTSGPTHSRRALQYICAVSYYLFSSGANVFGFRNQIVVRRPDYHFNSTWSFRSVWSACYIAVVWRWKECETCTLTRSIYSFIRLMKLNWNTPSLWNIEIKTIIHITHGMVEIIPTLDVKSDGSGFVHRAQRLCSYVGRTWDLRSCPWWQHILGHIGKYNVVLACQLVLTASAAVVASRMRASYYQSVDGRMGWRSQQRDSHSPWRCGEPLWWRMANLSGRDRPRRSWPHSEKTWELESRDSQCGRSLRMMTKSLYQGQKYDQLFKHGEKGAISLSWRDLVPSHTQGYSMARSHLATRV